MRRLGVFAGYFIFFAGLFPAVVFGTKSFVKPDIHNFYYPVWHATVESVKAGQLPLWNPHNGFGAPFLAGLQSLTFYPPAVLLYLGDFTRMFNVFIVLHLALAGFFTYLWMRELNASRSAAALSGLAFGLGGYALSMINLATSLCSLVYFPLALMVFKRALARPGLGWAMVCSLVLWLQHLAAGEPANGVMTVLVLGVMAAGESFRSGSRALKIYVLTVGIFTALTGVQSIPFIEFVLHSDRMQTAGNLVYSQPLRDLWGLIVPFFADIYFFVKPPWAFQCWVENLYAGAAVVALALLSLAGINQRRVYFHAGLGCAGVLLSLGAYNAFSAQLFRALPLLGMIRFPARFLFLLCFSLACMAGFGWERLTRQSRARGVAWVWLGLGTLMLAASFLLGSDGPIEALHRYASSRIAGLVMPAQFDALVFEYQVAGTIANARRAAIFFAVACTAIAAVAGGVRWKRPALILLLVSAVADLSLANATQPVVASSLLERPSGNISALLKDGGLYRAMSSPACVRRSLDVDTLPWGLKLTAEKDRLISNELLLYGVDDVFGFDSLYLKDPLAVRLLLFVLEDPSQGRLLDWLNVKYIASPRASLGASFELVNRTPSANLFINRNVLPRAFLVQRAVVVPDRRMILARLLQKNRDPERELFIEEEVPPLSVREGPDSANVLEYTPGRVRIHAQVAGKPWLFLSDSFYPGWTCRVDGKPVKIYRANFAFRAVRLTPGAHEVIFEYKPLSLRIGIAITLMAFLIIITILAANFANKR